MFVLASFLSFLSRSPVSGARQVRMEDRFDVIKEAAESPVMSSFNPSNPSVLKTEFQHPLTLDLETYFTEIEK